MLCGSVSVGSELNKVSLSGLQVQNKLAEVCLSSSPPRTPECYISNLVGNDLEQQRSQADITWWSTGARVRVIGAPAAGFLRK